MSFTSDTLRRLIDRLNTRIEKDIRRFLNGIFTTITVLYIYFHSSRADATNRSIVCRLH